MSDFHRQFRGPMPTNPIRGEYYEPNDERLKRKGDIVSHNYDFLNETQVQEVEEEYNSISNDIKPHIVARMLFVSFVLMLVATALEFFRIEFNFLPTFLELDVSIFPEFIALLLYGPFVGVAIVVLKNIAHSLIFLMLHGTISYVGELSNLITDILFIMIAFVFYRMVRAKYFGQGSLLVQRVRGLLVSGACSSVLTSAVSLPIMRYLIYPLFIRYFRSNRIEIDFLQLYADKNPNITSLWQGLFTFNFPWEIGKLMIVTLIATMVYIIITRRDYI